MTDKLRILWHSNAPWVGSGYGQQTKHALNILAELQEEGEVIEDIALSAFYGLNGGRGVMNGRTVYGNPQPPRDPWGNSTVVTWYNDFEANLLVTLVDAWILQPHIGQSTNWVPYYPVDHDPVPPAVVGHLQNATGRITMSQHGYTSSQEVGLDSIYIPHCVDTQVMLPQDRKRARDWIGFEDDELVFGMVAANVGTPPRKAFPEVFAAFQKVLEVEPKARLYLHSEARPGHIGVDLPHLAQLYDVEKQVSFTDPDKMWTHFMTEQEMSMLFSSFDVLLSPSMGEGFGVPIAEAQSCGTPVITHDVTAMPEITHAGWTVPRGRAWLTPQMAYQYMPEPEEIASAMLEACAMGRDGLHQLGLEGREFIVDHYDIAYVAETYWRPWVHQMLDVVNRREQEEAELIGTPEEVAVPV